MKIGIGIDTGGTCTDAVAYDFQEQKVLASAKAVTTKEDLSIGIDQALDGIPVELLHRAEMVSLSTTLATNACVENQGGRVGLIMIGVDGGLVDKVGPQHGLPSSGEILFVDAEVLIDGTVVREPDWSRFAEELHDWGSGKQAVAIVQFGAKSSGAKMEKQARKLVAEQMHVPVVCGHELFLELNMMRRAAGALLNARLLPVIEAFLKSVRCTLDRRGITAPVVIVRSDGTLMSEQFAAMRPVETLLCGPAASVMFGAEVAREANGLIVDMGGTTSDVAMVENGVPVRAEHGVDIGKWKTFVKGMYINTFGLGGDSAVRYDGQRKLILTEKRAIPLCMLAWQYPDIVRKLEILLKSGRIHSLCLHEFFCLARPLAEGVSYSRQETDFCKVLEKGPLSYEEAAEQMGCDLYNVNTERLEREGIVMRGGLTPTDIMHINGDFTAYCTEAACLGAEYVARATGNTPDELAKQIYDAVKKKLYCELVEMTLRKSPGFRGEIGKQLKENIAGAWESAQGGGVAFLAPSYTLGATLVGLGAPIHVFLADVARALHTRYVVPPHAEVANALGALVGNVCCEYEVEIREQADESGEKAYIVYGAASNRMERTLEEAVAVAAEEAQAAACKEARKRGAGGELKVTVQVDHQNAGAAEGIEIYLGSAVTARVIGKISI